MHLSCCGLDCMIRRQKNQIVRELWRLQANLGTEAENKSGPGRPQSTTGSANNSLQMKSALNSVLKRLDVDELENLLESIKSKGRSNTPCILLPQTNKSQNELTQSLLPSLTPLSPNEMTPEFLACRVWRWPDLSNMDILKNSPLCQSRDHNGDTDKVKICINPYHWCKVIQTDVKFIDHDSFSMGDGRVFKRDISVSTETETSGMEKANDYWCRIAYRELSEHIGQLFPVIPSSIDIFQDVPHGTGISLGTLHKSHIAKSDKVTSVRSKIGAGITLSNESDKIWLYNRSSSAIFVSSYSLNMSTEHGDSWRVYKVNPGHAIVVYDYQLMERWSPDPYIDDGPTDPHSIHISFVKGWGRDYRRQSVLSCACWLEVLLNVNR